MISVEEASRLVQEHTPIVPTKGAHISVPEAVVALERVVADRHLPPFDRVAMDGIAICRHEFNNGRRSFEIQGIQKAGEARKTLNKVSACLEVMTGTPLPTNADTVIRYEDVELTGTVCTVASSVKNVAHQQNVHACKSDCRKGDEVISAGELLLSPNWAIAASVGRSTIVTAEQPRIDIVSTGDELVAIDSTPDEHQIRRSNGSAVHASLLQNGFHNVHLHHISDSQSHLQESFAELLEVSSFLLITGGVSAGKFDYVPSVLADLKVNQVFHRVRQKPGKPLWFGVSTRGTPVFGLPGNPVSTLVCLHRYVLPALKKAAGALLPLTRPYARLTKDIVFKKSLTYFVPVAVEHRANAVTYASPIANQGSGDFVSLGQSTGFLELPEGEAIHSLDSCHPIFYWKE